MIFRTSWRRWTVGADGSIRNVHSGLCPEVDPAATANGTAVILWTRGGQGDQRWARA